jgi:hypothetical protein
MTSFDDLYWVQPSFTLEANPIGGTPAPRDFHIIKRTTDVKATRHWVWSGGLVGVSIWSSAVTCLIGCTQRLALPMTAEQLRGFNTGPASVAYSSQPDASQTECDLKATGLHSGQRVAAFERESSCNRPDDLLFEAKTPSGAGPRFECERRSRRLAPPALLRHRWKPHAGGCR